MRKIAILVVVLLLPTVTLAQSLNDQLDRLKAAQDQYDDAQSEAARIEAERARQQDERHQAQIRAAQRAQEERRKAENDERLKDKARLQSMEDEEHMLEMELKRANVSETKAMSAARAERANEYVDADLAKQKAETDVVQSEADARRNISEGAKELGTGIGKGAEAAGRGVEAESNGWFK